MKLFARCLLAAIIQLSIVLSVLAQSKEFSFEVPPSYVHLVFIEDPHCPIKLSGPSKVIAHSNGAFSLGYGMINISSANVESFLVKEIDWFGNRSYNNHLKVISGHVFSPGVRDYTLAETDVRNLDSFDEAIARKTGIISRPNHLWVVMIINVKLSDGTVYDASRTYSKLSEFLNEPFSKEQLSIMDLKEREKNLRSFVADLFLSD